LGLYYFLCSTLFHAVRLLRMRLAVQRRRF
jgi:hypothetical protein